MKTSMTCQILSACLLFAALTPAMSAPSAASSAADLVAEGNSFFNDGKLDAALWAYRQAAQRGNVNGTFAAGEVLLRQGLAGNGRERVLKLAEGLGFVYCAATNRHPQACVELSYALQYGVGVPTNLVCAYAWLAVAAQRDPSFKTNLDQLVIQLNPGEILEAQQLAREYAAGVWPPPVARPVELGDTRLQIQGITSGDHGSLVILNGHTLAAGETIFVPSKIKTQKTEETLTVSCRTIAPDFALVEVVGEPKLKLLAINPK
jgi:hypothetical protein